VSPGLGKCLDLQLDMKEDGERETIKEASEGEEPVNVQLYTCHGKDNQHYLISDGHFQSHALPGFCLEADEIKDNANVHLVKCVDGKAEQQWEFTGDGNVKVKGSEECLDVKAALKEDGTREAWHEIKAHTTVNVHLYKCHDPDTTERVNQLWSWAPFKDGQFVTEKDEEEAGMGPGSACGRPAGWCHPHDTYTDSVDCDGDGIPDPHCAQGDSSGYLASASGCADTWPHATCLAGVGAKYTGDYKALGVARSVVLPGLCAVFLAFAAIAGAVVGLKRWRQKNSPSLSLIPEEE